MYIDKIKKILIAVGLIGIALTIFSLITNIGYKELVTFPFIQVAWFLRWLSLSSSIGNVVAILIYVSISALPLFILIGVRRKKYDTEDILLVTTSILLFVTIYLMINPREMTAVIPGGLEDYGGIMLSSVTYINIGGYVVLRLLRRFSSSQTNHLLRDLSLVLVFTASFFVIALSFIYPLKVIEEVNNLRLSNTGRGDFFLSDFFIILKYAVIALPTGFGLVIILKSLDLIEALSLDRYSEKVIETAQILEGICKKAIIASTSATVVFSLLQVLFAKSLIRTDFQLSIPLTSIILVLMTMLLTRFFTETKEIKEENDMFV
ncbi:hypothetical protein EZV73_20315 [Acidaminobacter sp. JC074]|uniref:hypothetical protein n=1 Tax=Acidaminobacter sp. JC074 TaxID=2530199 RepID=UPI001F10E760|nr:hypothetical protein [Acidaminobacter sp. JC074]MCH4889936.1 hypothetical protein [Acidaminobacter sp. JC074]